MKFCPECGSKCIGTKFCADCGKDLRKYINDVETSNEAVEEIEDNENAADFSADFDTLAAFDGLAKLGMMQTEKQMQQSQEDSLAAFEVEKLSNGKYILKKLKNKDDCIVSVPDCVQIIADGAFMGTNVISVTLPEGLIKISKLAFADCTDLETINLPESLRVIGDEAFLNCFNLDLENLIIYENTRLGENVFSPMLEYEEEEEIEEEEDEDSELYSKLFRIEDGVVLEYYGDDTVTDLKFPSSVIAIADGVFEGCDKLESVTLPKNLKSIGAYAFRECYNLTTLYVNDALRFIGTSAFFLCERLEKVHISDIAAWCNIKFESYTSNPVCNEGSLFLEDSSEAETNLVIPETVEIIPDFAFSNFLYLENVTIPDSVTSIGVQAFDSCSNLKSINIPASVFHIGEEAFNYCISLTKITVDSKNPMYKSIDGNLYSKHGKRLIQYSIGKSAKDFTVPKSVTRIENGAFKGCENLTRVTIQNAVKNIGATAFRSCENLKSITIPETIYFIGDEAFWGCTSLETVTIPNGYVYIGDNVFEACDNLKEVRIPKSPRNYGYSNEELGIDSSAKVVRY